VQKVEGIERQLHRLAFCDGPTTVDSSAKLDILNPMAIRTVHDLERATHLFHALSDRTRLSILRRLRLGERCVCDLTDAMDAAQSRLSFHLKVLKDAGLVTDRRQGRWMYYTLNTDTLAEVGELVDALAAAPTTAERRAGCC
jgi:ArsR family transcriptional regulator, arsenate/arsenite/antimonite-responsive transcriptional repressor